MHQRIFWIILVSLLVGCAGQPSAKIIHLLDLQPLPATPAPTVVPLRVAVAAIISPRGTVDSYGSLLVYLEEQLNRPVELVQRRTYAEVNELVRTGEVDMAFVCTSAYVVGEREFEMQLLVAPQVQGDTVYYSLLLDPADSQAQTMAHLQGGVFAFTDPISTSGRNYPVYLVHQIGRAASHVFA